MSECENGGAYVGGCIVVLVQLGGSPAFVLSPGVTSERPPENTCLEHTSGGWKGEKTVHRFPSPIGQSNWEDL